MTRALAPKFDPARRCRPVELWPPADQIAWGAALDPGDVFEPGGPASRWAEITRQGVVKSYGRWLTWLDSTGPLDPALPAAGQVTPERVRAFIANLRAVNQPKTILFRIIGLAQAARVLAPDGDWAWLWGIVGRLQRTAQPSRRKRPLLVGSDELFALGQQLMREAENGDFSAWRGAVHYRDGLMIALLAARPLRMRNLAAIELGRHFVSQPGGQLAFAADETKSRQALTFPLPGPLLPALDRYLLHYRPILVQRRVPQQQEPRSLWISKAGRPMSRNGIYGRIVSLTQFRLGRRLNPHLFRDCAATSIATEDPEHVRITASVLGHSSLSTSERHYNHASAFQAARRYQAHVLTLRG